MPWLSIPNTINLWAFSVSFSPTLYVSLAPFYAHGVSASCSWSWISSHQCSNGVVFGVVMVSECVVVPKCLCNARTHMCVYLRFAHTQRTHTHLHDVSPPSGACIICGACAKQCDQSLRALLCSDATHTQMTDLHTIMFDGFVVCVSVCVGDVLFMYCIYSVAIPDNYLTENSFATWTYIYIWCMHSFKYNNLMFRSMRYE